jgi:hypothetical protein
MVGSRIAISLRRLGARYSSWIVRKRGGTKHNLHGEEMIWVGEDTIVANFCAISKSMNAENVDKEI